MVDAVALIARNYMQRFRYNILHTDFKPVHVSAASMAPLEVTLPNLARACTISIIACYICSAQFRRLCLMYRCQLLILISAKLPMSGLIGMLICACHHAVRPAVLYCWCQRALGPTHVTPALWATPAVCAQPAVL